MPNIQTARQILNSLFQEVRPMQGGPKPVAVGGMIPRGSVIRFHYRNWKHDPYPVLIVTSISWAARPKMNGGIEQPFIKGINLNYLTPFDFQRIIKNCGNAGFSYRSVMGDRTLSHAYRHYLVGFDNIVSLQMLDCKDILAARDVTRAYNPNQADAIKQAILRQLQQQANVKSSELQQKFEFTQQQPEPMPGKQMEMPFGEEGVE